MFEKLKGQKRIKDMEVNETGFLFNGIVIDENDELYLNLNSYVLKEFLIFTPIITKVSDKKNDFKIDFGQDIISANFDNFMPIKSDKIGKNFIKIDDLLSNKEHKTRRKEKEKEDRKYILNPFSKLFFSEKIIKKVIINTSIPEIINIEHPKSNGVIFYGPPGTGKTVLMKAISKSYERAGCYSFEINIAKISESYVGSLGNNLDAELQKILEEVDTFPCFIWMDESSSIVLKGSVHGSTSDYYQEAIDVLKKYISNYENMVFAITTNEDEIDFDDALTRNGRLKPIKIGYPNKNEINKIWKHFAVNEYNLFKRLTKKQISELVEITKNENGATIANFCKNYLKILKMELNKKKNKSKNFIDSLISGDVLSESDVRNKITFKKFKEDLKIFIDKNNKNDKMKLGFI